MAEKTYHPVDHGWAWMVVLGCTLSIFLMGGTLRTFGILLEEISKHFDVPASVAVLILTVESVGYTVAASIGVMLGEKFSARVVVIAAGVLGSIGISLSFLMINITFLICTVGLGLGLGNGLMHGNAFVMVSRYFEKRRALATGLAVAGGSIGQFVMPPILQYLISKYSVSGTLLILGGIYSHVVVSGSLYRPVSFYKCRRKRMGNVEADDVIKDEETKPLADSNQDQVITSSHQKQSPLTRSTPNLGSTSPGPQPKLVNKRLDRLKVPGENSLSRYASVEDIVFASVASLSHIDDDQASIKSERKSVFSRCCRQIALLKTLFDFSLLKSPPFLYYCLAQFLNFAGNFNVLFFIPSHAVARGFSKYEAAFLISINGILDLVGRVGCGWFADLKVVKRYKMLVFVMVVNGVNSLVLPFASEYWWLGIHCGIYGASCGAYLPLLPVLTVDLFGLDMLPKALAILLFVTGAGAGIEQPLLGLLRDYTGSLDIVFYFSGSVALVGAVLTVFLPVVVKPPIQDQSVTVNNDKPLDIKEPIVSSPEVDDTLTENKSLADKQIKI